VFMVAFLSAMAVKHVNKYSNERVMKIKEKL
jgi:hypothetical protein